GLEVGSIRHIQGIGYGVLEFLGVGTTLDVFQNIILLYFQYGVLVFTGYDVLSLFPLWSLNDKVFNNEFKRMTRMEDDLFTNEGDVANIPCNSNMDDDSEQRMSHEVDDDTGYDPSNVAFT
nr:hypothetical protein [Tanacetum cinerariifolium]